jgi:hypothetical protein
VEEGSKRGVCDEDEQCGKTIRFVSPRSASKSPLQILGSAYRRLKASQRSKSQPANGMVFTLRGHIGFCTLTFEFWTH